MTALCIAKSELPLPRPLAASGETSFLVLDAARDDAVRAAIRTSGLPSRSLYDGAKAHELARAAPYLVELPPREQSDALRGASWGRAWGIEIAAAASLAEMRSHLRRLLLVTGPDGQELYFRFYDPRVLGAFLPVCDAQQSAVLFSVPAAVMLEDERGAAIVYRRDGAPAPVVRHLTIAPAQMHAFGEATERAFLRRVVAFLREQFATAASRPSDELAQFVATQLAHGRRYRLISEHNLVCYVLAAWMLGPEFDAHPAARATLDNPRLLPSFKTQWLESWIRRQHGLPLEAGAAYG